MDFREMMVLRDNKVSQEHKEHKVFREQLVHRDHKVFKV
jgi:hypothetical protein